MPCLVKDQDELSDDREIADWHPDSSPHENVCFIQEMVMSLSKGNGLARSTKIKQIPDAAVVVANNVQVDRTRGDRRGGRDMTVQKHTTKI
jgi:hypothetical protein